MKIIVILIQALLVGNIYSQKVPLNAMLEHYTNTKCSACANRNSSLIANKNNFPSLNYISIHPSAPYSSCILSQQNKTTNDARTNFYSIYGGTPRIVINGQPQSGSSDYGDSSILKPHLNQMSSFSLAINIKRITTDSFSYRLVIIKEDTSSLTISNLFSGCIEDTVFINGGNGELSHYNVLRHGTQENINLPIMLGDSIVKEFRSKLNSNWDANRMKAFVIIQNSSDKKLIQSGFSKVLTKLSSATQSNKVPLNAILEHFTNTKCSVCASRNPGLIANKNQFPKLAYISIHPSSPYSSCVLSQQNKMTNDARTNFYSIYGATPRILINGTVINSSSNYNDSSILTPYLNLMSSFDLKVNLTRTKLDSLEYQVIIKKVDTSSLTSAVLFSGNIEDTVNINGGNGELIHYNVLRQASQESKMLPFVIGDSLIYLYRAQISSNWNPDRIRSFAILQNSENKSILQSGMSKLLLKATSSSISENNDQNQIQIYPNPVSSHLNIESNKQILSYKITNLTGKIVQFGRINNKLISVENLEKGIYLILIEDKKSNSTVTNKFIKE